MNQHHFSMSLRYLKRFTQIIIGFYFFAGCSFSFSQTRVAADANIALVWGVKVSGSIEVTHGRLKKLSVISGKGKTSASHFSFSGSDARLLVQLERSNRNPGPGPTVVS